MISRILDVTEKFNQNNGIKLDVSEWQQATFQFVNPSGTIAITGSNDANAVTGVSDGNAVSSTNYTTIQAINLATGNIVTTVTTVATAGLYKVMVDCKFVQFGGASAAADKVIVFFTKPY